MTSQFVPGKKNNILTNPPPASQDISPVTDCFVSLFYCHCCHKKIWILQNTLVMVRYSCFKSRDAVFLPSLKSVIQLCHCEAVSNIVGFVTVELNLHFRFALILKRHSKLISCNCNNWRIFGCKKVCKSFPIINIQIACYVFL